MFLEDIDPIFKFYYKFSFSCFSDRCWSHIQDFREFIRRIFGICRHASFPTNSNLSMCNPLRFPEILFLKWVWNSWFRWSGLVSPQDNWFGQSWTRPPSPKSINMKIFRFFGKWILKVTSPKCIRIILGSFCAILKFTVDMSPPRPLQTPNPDLFVDFPDFYRKYDPYYMMLGKVRRAPIQLVWVREVFQRRLVFPTRRMVLNGIHSAMRIWKNKGSHRKLMGQLYDELSNNNRNVIKKHIMPISWLVRYYVWSFAFPQRKPK